jgi:hypothetical protein
MDKSIDPMELLGQAFEDVLMNKDEKEQVEVEEALLTVLGAEGYVLAHEDGEYEAAE